MLQSAAFFWMRSKDHPGSSLNILATASRWLRPPSMRSARWAMPDAMMALHTITGRLPELGTRDANGKMM